MPLTVTLELSPEAEAELRAKLARHDAEGVRRVLMDVLTPTIEALLQQKLPQNDADWEAAADQLAGILAARIAADAPVLSERAVSRAGIYGDHP